MTGDFKTPHARRFVEALRARPPGQSRALEAPVPNPCAPNGPTVNELAELRAPVPFPPNLFGEWHNEDGLQHLALARLSPDGAWVVTVDEHLLHDAGHPTHPDMPYSEWTVSIPANSQQACSEAELVYGPTFSPFDAVLAAVQHLATYSPTV